MTQKTSQDILRTTGRIKTTGTTGTRRHLRLPVIDVSAPAVEALQLMRRHKCSGIIAFEQGRPMLYTAPSLVFALSKDPSKALSDVAHVLELKPRRSTIRGLGVVRPWFFASRQMKTLMYDRFGSVGGGSRITYVVSAALIPELQASPKDCYCRVDLKAVPGGTNGSDCPNGHKGSVRCV